MDVKQDLAASVGNTPLIRLNAASEATGCAIYGKAEFMNPGQSVKDRAALYIIRDALARGELHPGGTIVEGTAGNTGIGLALVGGASMGGFKTVIVIPETQSEEKKDMIRLAGGAELVQVPAAPYKNPNNYVRYSERLAKKLAETEPNGAVWANQFDNVANRQAHVETTGGPEIWEQTGGRVDGFTCAVGSGGTLAGVAEALQPKGVKVALTDPMARACSRSIATARPRPRAARSPRASARAASPGTSMGSSRTCCIRSPTKRRCRSSLTCWNTKGSALAARLRSISPGGHAHGTRNGGAGPHHRHHAVRLWLALSVETVQPDLPEGKEPAGSGVA